MQKCSGKDCPVKNECLRLAKEGEKTMSQAPFDTKTGRCDHIIKSLMV